MPAGSEGRVSHEALSISRGRPRALWAGGRCQQSLAIPQTLSISRVRPHALLAGRVLRTVPAEEFVSRVLPRALSWPKPGPVCYDRSIAVVPCECAARPVAAEALSISRVRPRALLAVRLC